MAKYILHSQSDYSALFDALCIDDIPQPADAIFVFGSPSDARIKKAVELYKDGYVEKIVVSGRGPFYADDTVAVEARRMATYAREAGVPEQYLIVEPDSITLPDNVKRTIDLMERISFRPKSIIAVATTYIQQRAAMEWYKFSPWKVSVKMVSASADDIPAHMQRTGWSMTERGVNILLNEYNKIIVEQAMDLFRVGKVQ